jgi:hypothetical protein
VVGSLRGDVLRQYLSQLSIPDALLPTPPERQPEAPTLPPAGWYPAEPGIERWWDGNAWGQQVRAVPQASVQMPQVSVQMPHVAVTRQPVRTNHTFHLIMTLITCGLWLPVWAIVALLNKVSKQRVVTRYR